MRYRIAIVLFLVLQGCAPEPPPYRVTANQQDLMTAVIEPAAATYWTAVGTIMTLEGTEEIAPQTHREWEAVRNAAVVIAESGNLLLLPERRLDDGQWVAFSQALIAAGQRALEAANVRDPQAVFTAGGELYTVCNECHASYSPDALHPGYRLDD